MASGKVEPRFVVGSVSAAELAVTLAASAGFLLGLGTQGIEAPLVLAILIGGVIAAPLAAWLVRHADPSVLGVVIGTLLLVTNARTLLIEVGVPGALRLPVIVTIAAAGVVIALRVRRDVQAQSASRRSSFQDRNLECEAPEGPTPEPSPEAYSRNV